MLTKKLSFEQYTQYIYYAALIQHSSIKGCANTV